MRLLILLVLILSAGQSLAKEKISIVTYPIPLMIESESKGLFVVFLKSLFEKQDVEIDIIMLPRQRALEYFRMKKALILVPSVGKDPVGTDSLRTVKFYEKKDFLFFRKGEPYPTIKSARRKTIGITLSYPYSKDALAEQGVSFEIAPSDEANFNKLNLKRIDAFLVEEVTGLHVMKSTGIKGITYDKDHPVSSLAVYFEVQNNAQGRKWLKFLDEKLKYINKTRPLKEQFKVQGGF